MKNIIVLIICLFLVGCSSTNIEKGQIWEYTGGDPFREPYPTKLLVLDVKNYWVKYKNIATGQEDVSTISLFLIESKLYKQAPKDLVIDFDNFSYDCVHLYRKDWDYAGIMDIILTKDDLWAVGYYYKTYGGVVMDKFLQEIDIRK